MIGFKLTALSLLVLVAAIGGVAERFAKASCTPYKRNWRCTFWSRTRAILGFGACWEIDFRYRRRAYLRRRSLMRSAKTRAMGAGRCLGLSDGNVFEVSSYCCCRSFLRLWPHRDCHLLYVGVPSGRHIRYCHCRIRPYRYCDNFEAKSRYDLLYGLIIAIPTVIVAGLCFQIAGAL